MRNAAYHPRGRTAGGRKIQPSAAQVRLLRAVRDGHGVRYWGMDILCCDACERNGWIVVAPCNRMAMDFSLPSTPPLAVAITPDGIETIARAATRCPEVSK